MAKFCTHCGTQFNDNIKFCPGCGAATATPSPAQQNVTQYTTPVYGAPAWAGSGAVRQGIPAPGFSDRENHPEILAAVKKNRKAARAFAVFLVPFPVIGAVLYALVSKKTDIGQAALMGGIVSAIFLAFALFSFIKERAKNQ